MFLGFSLFLALVGPSLSSPALAATSEGGTSTSDDFLHLRWNPSPYLLGLAGGRALQFEGVSLTEELGFFEKFSVGPRLEIRPGNLVAVPDYSFRANRTTVAVEANAYLSGKVFQTGFLVSQSVGLDFVDVVFENSSFDSQRVYNGSPFMWAELAAGYLQRLGRFSLRFDMGVRVGQMNPEFYYFKDGIALRSAVSPSVIFVPSLQFGMFL